MVGTLIHVTPAPVDDSEESKKKLLVPIKNRGEKRKDFASSTVKYVEKLLERDPAKDILEFCRRENEKASQRAQDATYADDCVSTNARF